MKARKTRLKKTIRSVKRYAHVYATIAAVVIIAAFGFVAERNRMTINYSILLNTIASGESNGNYNAYFGHQNNTAILFTNMRVRDVLDWQERFVAEGSPSSAVGKYQFVRPTLAGLVKEMEIKETEIFSEHLQDRLAVRLLERRGLNDYLKGKMSREELAHNLSKEWAALPRVTGVNPTASYYEGDGLNHVQISVDEILVAIDHLKRPSES